MKPISLFGIGLMFFARFVSIFFIFYYIDWLKELAAGRNLFSLRKHLAQTSAEISPPNQV